MLSRCQDQLGLPHAIPRYRIGEVTSPQTWKANTKPWDTFFTRIFYVVGANLLVCLLSYGWYRSEGRGSSLLIFLLVVVVAHAVVVRGALWLDLRQLKHETAHDNEVIQ